MRVVTQNSIFVRAALSGDRCSAYRDACVEPGPTDASDDSSECGHDVTISEPGWRHVWPGASEPDQTEQ